MERILQHFPQLNLFLSDARVQEFLGTIIGRMRDSMSNEVQVLMNVDILGQTATIYGDAYDPLFLAKDVAEWIGYDQSSVTKMIANVDDDEKLIGTIFREGQGRPLALLTENGVSPINAVVPLPSKFCRRSICGSF